MNLEWFDGLFANNNTLRSDEDSIKRLDAIATVLLLAERLLRESLEAFRALGIRYMIAHVIAPLAQCQKKLNKEAEENLREAKAMYEGMDLPELIDFFEGGQIREVPVHTH